MSIGNWLLRHCPWVERTSDRAYTVTVPIIQGKQRPRRDTIRHRTYTPTQTQRAERLIRREFQRVYGAQTPPTPKNCPVAVRIVVRKALPTSSPKNLIEEIDYTLPDLDNVAKLVMDALNGVAYVDDKQVQELVIEREPRIRRWNNETEITVTVPGAWQITSNKHRKYRALR